MLKLTYFSKNFAKNPKFQLRRLNYMSQYLKVFVLIIIFEDALYSCQNSNKSSEHNYDIGKNKQTDSIQQQCAPHTTMNTFWSCNTDNAAITSNQKGFMAGQPCKFSGGWSANPISPTYQIKPIDIWGHSQDIYVQCSTKCSVQSGRDKLN